MSRRRPDTTRPAPRDASAPRDSDASAPLGLDASAPIARRVRHASLAPVPGPADADPLFTPRRPPFDPNDPDALQRYCADELGLWMSCEMEGCRRARCCAGPNAEDPYSCILPCFERHRAAVQARMRPWRPILEARLRELDERDRAREADRAARRGRRA